MNHPPTPTLDAVVKNAARLPSAPWLLPKLMAQLADPDSAADQVESLIRMDAGLAVSTLRMANSAYFHNATPCDTLQEAVVRLGFREIYRLATTTMASAWLSSEVDGYGWRPGDLYRHSLTVAVAGDLLARHTERCEPEVAYTGGLLHDVGKLALAFTCSSHFERIRAYQREQQCPWRAAEHAVLGYDHTDISGELLRTWDFPASLIEVVRHYPRPRLSAEARRDLVIHIHAAKHLALCLGTGVGEEGFQSELDESALHDGGIGPELAETLLPEVHELTERLLATKPR